MKSALSLQRDPEGVSVDDCPPWAQNVRRSLAAAEGTEAFDAMTERTTEYVDEETNLVVMGGPGVHVVAVDDPPTGPRLAQAVAKLHELKQHPLEIAALALPADTTLPPDEVMRLADEGIAIVRDEGHSAQGRASAYLHRVLALRAEGLAHLQQAMGAEVSPSAPTDTSRTRMRR
jgi:hypothetical protein